MLDHSGRLENSQFINGVGEVPQLRERKRGSTSQLSISVSLKEDTVYLIVRIGNGNKGRRHRLRTFQTYDAPKKVPGRVAQSVVTRGFWSGAQWTWYRANFCRLRRNLRRSAGSMPVQSMFRFGVSYETGVCNCSARG